METWINIYIPPEPSHIAIVDTISNWKVTKKEQFWNHLKIFHWLGGWNIVSPHRVFLYPE